MQEVMELNVLDEKAQRLEAIRESITSNAVFDAAYVVMNVLATLVACYGLFANSPAVVIGAMIIAMLLGPITGVALGLVDGNNQLLGKAIAALGGGVLVVMTTAFIIGRIHIDVPITNEIMARTAPNFMDLMIALGGGAAGAYAVISPRLSVAFVGVAIATALVPPLSSCSILLARGEYKLAAGAFLLAFTNIVAIQLASSIIMWFNGFHQITSNLIGQRKNRVLLRNSISVIILVGLSVILVANLRTVVGKLIFEANTRQVITQELKAFPGSHLAEVRFNQADDKEIVRAVVRGPHEFTSEQVRIIEEHLPTFTNGKTVELRLRFVPTTVLTKDGILYAPDDALDNSENQGN